MSIVYYCRTIETVLKYKVGNVCNSNFKFNVILKHAKVNKCKSKVVNYSSTNQ